MISNFSTRLLSLSLLIGVATLGVANAQASISSVNSGTLQDRVTTLERISNGQAQLLQQLQQQLSSTQSDIDSLRGQIQENQYQLSQFSERQKDLYQQLDKLSSAGNSSDAHQAAPVADAAKNEAKSGGGTDAASRMQSGNANTDYNSAVALVLEKKQYDRAISAFQAFVKNYPNSTYIPNANYWLGQLSYNKGKLDDAAYYFATVVKNYPKSPKSADALFKVGLIMQDKGDNGKANAVYQQVIKQYPDTNAARQATKRLSSS